MRSERRQGQAGPGQEGQRYLLFMAEDAGFHQVFFHSKSIVGAPGGSVGSASDSSFLLRSPARGREMILFLRAPGWLSC